MFKMNEEDVWALVFYAGTIIAVGALVDTIWMSAKILYFS